MCILCEILNVSNNLTLLNFNNCSYLLEEEEREEEEEYVPDVEFAFGFRTCRECICSNGDRRLRRSLRLFDLDVSASEETEGVLEQLVESSPGATHGSGW